MNQITFPARGRSGLRGRWAAAPTARRCLAIETLERRCPLDAAGLLGGVDAGELADHTLKIDPPSDSLSGYQAGATDPPAPTEQATGEEAVQDSSPNLREGGPGDFANGPGDFAGGTGAGEPLQEEGPSAGNTGPDGLAGDGLETPPISTGEIPDGGGEPTKPDAPPGSGSGQPSDAFAPPLAPIGSISLNLNDTLRGGSGSPNLRAAQRPVAPVAAASDGVKLNLPHQRSEISLTKTRYYDAADRGEVDTEGLLIEAELPLRSLARQGMPASAGIQIGADDSEPAAPAAPRSPVAIASAAGAAKPSLVRNTPRREAAAHPDTALHHDVALVALLDAQSESRLAAAASLAGQRDAASGAMRVHSQQEVLWVSVRGHSGHAAGGPSVRGPSAGRQAEPEDCEAAGEAGRLHRPLEFLSGLSRWAALGWLLSHGIARRHVGGQGLVNRR